MSLPLSHPSSPTLVERLALVLSALGSPYFVGVGTAVALVVRLPGPLPKHLLEMALSLFCSTLIPFLYTYVMMRQGRITDLHIAVREHRGPVFAVALTSSGIGMLLLVWMHAPAPLLALGTAFLVNGAVFAVVTRVWKISMHVAFTAAAPVVLWRIGLPEVALACALLGLAIAWARIHRGRHTLQQCLASVPLAIGLTLAVFLAWGV